MTTEIMNELTQNQDTPKSNYQFGPGSILKSYREKLGFSVEQISNQLHLTSTIINDLEQNNYERIGALVFIRGYLRAYAKYLNLNPDEIVEEFNKLGVVDKNAALPNTNNIIQQPVHDREHLYTWLVGGVSMFILLAGFVVWHLSHNGKSENSSTTVTSSIVSPNKQFLISEGSGKAQTLKLNGEPNPLVSQGSNTVPTNKTIQEKSESGPVQLANKNDEKIKNVSSSHNDENTDVTQISTKKTDITKKQTPENQETLNTLENQTEVDESKKEATNTQAEPKSSPKIAKKKPKNTSNDLAPPFQ